MCFRSPCCPICNGLLLAASQTLGHGKTPMQINVPDSLLPRLHLLTEAEVRRAFAVGLFVEEFFTLAQAARLADVDRLSFQRILADHEIPLHYSMEELEGDLATIEELKRLRAQTGDKPWLALRGSAQFVGDPVAPVVSEAEINALQKEEGNAGS